MNARCVRSVVLAVVLGLTCAPSVSIAGDNLGSWWLWSGLGYGYGSSVYNSGKLFVPPYYAVHPPVYYGNRVRTSYGESPFPKMPSRETGERAAPVIIVNPLVTAAPAPSGTESPGSSGIRPTIVVNPYYVSDTPPESP